MYTAAVQQTSCQYSTNLASTALQVTYPDAATTQNACAAIRNLVKFHTFELGLLILHFMNQVRLTK